MKTNLEKLSALATARPEKAKRRAEERRTNRAWLAMSQDIALAIHYHLRQSGMSQKSLAEKLGVSPTYVAKLLKGNENLTLETISKVQEAIGQELVGVCRPYEHTEEATPCTLAPTKFTSRSRTFHYSISTGSGYAPAGDAA